MKAPGRKHCDFCKAEMPESTRAIGLVGIRFGFASQADICEVCDELLTVAELRKLLSSRLDREVKLPFDPSQGKVVG